MKNFFLSCKEIRIEPTSPKTYYGCFYLGPFENGQSLTIANALRRTLLSEISGLAITSVKINSVSHEYESLRGVRENVLDILLNLKEIVLKSQRHKPLEKSHFGHLQVRGPGTVRAADLNLPPSIECVDPDQYIATLAEDGFLNLKLKIDEGTHFIFLNEQVNSLNSTSSESDKNFLKIDAVFTPIKKVNYTIESYGAKSIEKANEVIILEIWTNGSISPHDAICQTLTYLRVLFNQLGDLQLLQSLFNTYSIEINQNFRLTLNQLDRNLQNLDQSVQSKNCAKPKISLTELCSRNQGFLQEKYFDEIHQEMVEDWKSYPLNELNLPFRILRCLENAKIHTVGEVLTKRSIEFTKIPGFGKQSLFVLQKILETKGLFLKDSELF